MEWCPGSSTKGRPRNSWMQDEITEMREKGINNIGMDRQGTMEKENKNFRQRKIENFDTMNIAKPSFEDFFN